MYETGRPRVYINWAKVCFSDPSDSLNSQNSLNLKKFLLHLGITSLCGYFERKIYFYKYIFDWH